MMLIKKFRRGFWQSLVIAVHDYHDTCKREQSIGFVLGKLGVEPGSSVGNLLAPGIRKHIDRHEDVNNVVEWFQNNQVVQRKIDDYRNGRG